VALAEHLGDAELVNADSRQVIRGLQVGTCTPTPEELRGVPCHLLGVRDIDEHFSVADWARLARAVLDALAERGTTAILVGGTGLYVSAAIDGLALDGGAPQPALRRERDALSGTPDGLARLAGELRARDPHGASTIDLRNPRRVVRALELVDARGSIAAARRRGPGRPATLIGLDAPPDVHRALVAARAEAMFRAAALEREVESALARGASAAALDAAGIGYREAIAVREGRLSRDQAVADVTRRTLRYARAQRTWFRRDPRVRWHHRGAGPVEALLDDLLLTT
jgi:tRNA dimethylallyltransferase